MHLSKKAKIILLTTIPSAAIVSAVAIATPIIVISEQASWHEINSSKNIKPKFVSKTKIEELLNSNATNGSPILQFNPENYDRQFFIEKIANKSITYSDKKTKQQVTTNSNDLLFNKIEDPRHKEVKYKINYIGFVNDQIEANITKSHNGKSKSYTSVVKLSGDWFFQDDPIISRKSFLNYSVNEFESFVKKGTLNVDAANVSSNNISEIKQENLSLTSKSSSIIVEPKNNLNYINNGNGIFNYNSSNDVSFEILPSGSKIYGGIANDAWPTISANNNDAKFTSNGYLDFERSELFKFLFNNKANLILPEITEQNYESDYSYIIDTKAKKFIDLTSEEKEKLQIARVMFNPSLDPFSNNGILMPNKQYCALVVKLQLADSFVYTVIWQNILQSSNASIIANAPEIELEIKKGLFPSAQEIVDSRNYDFYFEFKTIPTEGLQYKIKNVEIPTENNEEQTRVIVTIEVYSLEDTQISPKVYKTEVASSIKSLSQQKFDDLVVSLVGDGKQGLLPITPSCSITTGENPQANKVTTEELIIYLNSIINNLEEFNKKVVLTKNPGTEKLDYIPKEVLWYSDTKIQIEYEVVSADNKSITPTNQNYKNVTVIVNVV